MLVFPPHFKLLTLLCFFPIITFSSSNFLQTIALNTLETHPFFFNSSFGFQVLGNPSLGLGTFHVSVSSIGSKLPFGLQIRRHNYSEENGLILQQILSFEDTIDFSFNANASETQYFKLDTLPAVSLSSGFANFSFFIRFNQIKNVIQLNKPFKFEFIEGSMSNFACDFKDQQGELLHVAIKTLNTTPSVSSQPFNLKFINTQGLCIKAPHLEAWLCYLLNPEKVIAFSVYNPSSTGFYELSISKVEPKIVGSDFETTFPSFIPGFGSLFKVNLPVEGTLKVQAKHQNNIGSIMISSSSLYGLFEILTSFENNKIDPIVKTNDNEESLIVHTNRGKDNQWFYFVQETGTDHFSLISRFIKQMTLEIDTQATYYIDPEIYEYQEVELKLGVGDFFSKYEADLYSSKPVSSMKLFFSSNPLGSPYSSYRSQSISSADSDTDMASQSTIHLSFNILPYDSSAFITIYTTEKGSYTLKVSKVQTGTIVGIVIPVIVITYLLAYALIYAIQICKSRKPRLIHDDISDLEVNNHDDIELQNERFQPQSEIDNEIMVNNPSLAKQSNPNVVSLVEKLKSQHNCERTAGNMPQNLGKEGEYNLDAFDQEINCNICFEAKKVVIFEPCGHKCTCAYCALVIIQMSMSCPLCRQIIFDVEIEKDEGSIKDGRQGNTTMETNNENNC